MISVIILSAGNSARMNGINKQLAEINGKPVFIMSALAFDECPKVGEIIIAVPSGKCKRYEELAKSYRLKKFSCVVEGGNSRFQSMKNALGKVSENADFIAFHDGARPLIAKDDIEKVFADAEEYGAAIAAVRAVDTVKIIGGDGFIEKTPDRSRLFYAQTPQVFRKDMFLSCLEKLGNKAENVTDDSLIPELCGEKVRLTEISYCNMKITRSEDLTAAKAIFDSEKKSGAR